MNPLAMIGVVVGVGAVGYAAWRFLRPDELIDKTDGDGDGDGEDIFDIIDQDDGSGDDPTKCKRTGRRYNPDIWKGPEAVRLGFKLIGFGYDGNAITTAAKAQISEAQREFARRGLPSHKGLDSEGDSVWFDGVPGACTLNDLEVAVEMKRDGKW